LLIYCSVGNSDTKKKKTTGKKGKERGYFYANVFVMHLGSQRQINASEISRSERKRQATGVADRL